MHCVCFSYPHLLLNVLCQVSRPQQAGELHGTHWPLHNEWWCQVSKRLIMLLEGLCDSLILTCSSVCHHLGFFVSVSHLSLVMQTLTPGQASCEFAPGIAHCISEIYFCSTWSRPCSLRTAQMLPVLLCACLISVLSNCVVESCKILWHIKD